MPLGNITTIFGGQSYPSSFIDSGSNGIYFLDAAASGLPFARTARTSIVRQCRSPFPPRTAAPTGSRSPALFNVGNADALDPRFAAFNEIAGPNPGGFDFGLGFFFGRSVFTAIEGQGTPGGAGPYFAY